MLTNDLSFAIRPLASMIVIETVAPKNLLAALDWLVREGWAFGLGRSRKDFRSLRVASGMVVGGGVSEPE